MSSNRRLWIVGGVLALVVAIPMLFPAGAGAQSNFKLCIASDSIKVTEGCFPLLGWSSIRQAISTAPLPPVDFRAEVQYLN
jgi:hypothetical protein